MPRTISVALKAWLQGGTLTMATIALLTRPDGTHVGFTSHDRDLAIGGVTYAASNAITPSAVKQQTGTGVDNLDIVGLLSSAHLTETDILAGLYDNSKIQVSICNWADLTMGTMIVMAGILGEVRVRDGQFSAEVRSLAQYLTQQIGVLATPTCRVTNLGDARCTVDLTPYTYSSTVTAIDSPTEIRCAFATGVVANPTLFAYGIFKFTSGDNDGEEREIQSAVQSSGTEILFILQEEPGYVVQVGDTMTAIQGCDRSFFTCCHTFNNAVNFRGEPGIPGSDAIQSIGRPGY